MSLTQGEIKDAIFALNLKGQDNILFYDRKMVNTQQLQTLAASWPESLPFGAILIGVHVPEGKTLRSCVLKLNPVIAKLVALWRRLTKPSERKAEA